MRRPFRVTASSQRSPNVRSSGSPRTVPMCRSSVDALAIRNRRWLGKCFSFCSGTEPNDDANHSCARKNNTRVSLTDSCTFRSDPPGSGFLRWRSFSLSLSLVHCHCVRGIMLIRCARPICAVCVLCVLEFQKKKTTTDDRRTTGSTPRSHSRRAVATA